MKTSDFYYDLPERLIAQSPLEKRDNSRFIIVARNTGALTHPHFYDLPPLPHPGGIRADSGGNSGLLSDSVGRSGGSDLSIKLHA